MKIREIHIDGFGVFSGYSLTGLGPGVNIIFGVNETGKTTLMKFIRYTLFGYPRTVDERMAPLEGGVHGGRLVVETAYGAYTIERRSGPNGGPFEIIPGAPVSALLGSANADLFGNVYAFSLDELVGLDSLKASGVEDRIFSIGLGLGGRSINGIAAALSSSADAFYKPNGRVHKAADLVREIGALTERINEIKGRLPLYRTLARDIAELEKQISATDCEIDAHRAELKRSEQLLACVPYHLEISGAERELEQTEEIEGLSFDIGSAYAELVRRREEKASELKAVFEGFGETPGINRLLDKAGSVSLNEDLLRRSAGVEFLRGNLEAYLQNVDRREEALAAAAEIEEQVAGSISEINPDWTLKDLERFAGAVVILDRLEWFRDSFADVEETRLRLEAERDAESRGASVLTVRALFFTVAAVLAIVSVPLLLSSEYIWGAALLAAALVIVVGSFYVASGVKRTTADERLVELRRRRVQPLRLSYGAYLRSTLRLSPELSPDKAIEVVKEATRLRDRLNEARRTRERIAERLDPAIGKFESEAEALAEAAGIAIGSDRAAAARAVIEAFDSERRRSEETERQRERLEDLEARADVIVGNVAEIEAEMTELFSAVGASGPEDFQRKISESRRAAELRETIAAARLSVAKTVGDEGRVDRVLAELGRTEKADIELRIERISARIAEFEAARGGSKEELGRMRQKMSDIEAETELTELLSELETFRALLRKGHEEWLANRVALKLLSRVKESYEREKQPAVIRNSGRYFRSITGGAYERVSVSIEDGTVAVFDERHAAKSIGQLSRGTKEQLLLSLRLGFIEEYERESEPLPVIVDDVFVNFDEARAQAAANVFWEFAEGADSAVSDSAVSREELRAEELRSSAAGLSSGSSAGSSPTGSSAGSSSGSSSPGSSSAGFSSGSSVRSGGSPSAISSAPSDRPAAGSNGGSASRGRLAEHSGGSGGPARQVLIFTCHPRTREIFGDRNVNLIEVDR
ncbi:MAG: AAA family ATPase [Acidobacteriota bacterium]|nr:MAG: AAA family ATPase [Acidobacteriota bacterium]